MSANIVTKISRKEEILKFIDWQPTLFCMELSDLTKEQLIAKCNELMDQVTKAEKKYKKFEKNVSKQIENYIFDVEMMEDEVCSIACFTVLEYDTEL